MKNIASAFVKAQQAFQPALKTATNPHFRSKYADLSACVEAVIDALNANGIALMQHSSESESGVVVETVFLHESGEELRSGKLHVPAAKNDPQGYGSALTYARRYSLMAACGIAPEDDDGNAASKGRAQPKGPVIGARDGIGDDLPDEWKTYLADLAMTVAYDVNHGNVQKAKDVIAEAKLEPDQEAWFFNKLDSKVRSALKK